MEVRAARSEDADAVAEIWYRGWLDAHSGRVPDALVVARTEESFSERAVARIPDTVVATVDGLVAGFVMVAGAEVEQVFVSIGFRGHGVAGALLSTAEQAVAAAGFKQAWLAVVPGNGRARAFYARQGWVDEGPFLHSAAVQDGVVPVPCHRYTKALGR
jgi:ribosomal protein S18 acetylase RimI-like enzyme